MLLTAANETVHIYGEQGGRWHFSCSDFLKLNHTYVSVVACWELTS